MYMAISLCFCHRQYVTDTATIIPATAAVVTATGTEREM